MLLSAALSTLVYLSCVNLPPLRSVLRPRWPPSSLLLLGSLLFLKCQRAALGPRKEETRSSEERPDPTSLNTLRGGDSRGERREREGLCPLEESRPGRPHTQGWAEGRTGVHPGAACTGPLPSTKSQPRLPPTPSIRPTWPTSSDRAHAREGMRQGRCLRKRQHIAFQPPR